MKQLRSRIMVAALCLTATLSSGVWAQAPGGATLDPGWPRVVISNGSRMIVNQPQLDSWEGLTLKGRIAVEITPKGAQAAVPGAVWFEATTSVSMEKRTVLLSKFK